ncbi:MAG TPA: dihydropteroate synthase [Pirellulales bacterium]|jgi:dihydropteroate synthase|nr:dihydropteroate synthase [Pirellulales bacterium]
MSTAESDSLASRFPARATRWRIGTRTIELPRRPLVMGIVNVTPDSFSDGGIYQDPIAAANRCLEMAAAGADLIDIGGESTRPYANPTSLADELARVVAVLKRLAGKLPIPISIDTTKAAVARAAIDAGAEIINDVSALTADPAMIPLAATTGAGVCAMHMLGTPATMQDDPRYGDVVIEVRQYLARRRDALVSAGIDRRRIALDPGIGFGKTHQHNLTLLAHCHELHALGCPLLVGHSRKGFIGKVLGDKEADRLAGTIGTALSLARQGVQIVRVHDVGPVRQALMLFEATGGIDGQVIEIGEKA